MKQSLRLARTGFGVCALMASMVHENAHATDTWQPQLLTSLATVSESANDLGVTGGSDETSMALNIRPSVLWNPQPTAAFYAKGRVLASTGNIQQDADEGGARSDTFASLDELWGTYYFDPEHRGFSLQLGRQRIKEDESLWWDTDIEAFRLRYQSTLLNGFIGIGEKLTAYRTDDSDFDESDESILRLMGELEYQWHYGQSVSIRAMVQRDHSGHIEAGSSLSSIGVDTEDLDAEWLGVRASGERSLQDGRWGYLADASVMRGDRARIASTAGNAIAAVSQESVSGWALDIGGWREWDHYLKPKLGLHIAQTSKGDEYVQTGLHSNRAYLTDFDSRFYRYGELYRPNLNNIRVVSLFSGIDWRRQHELSVVGHYYTRLDTDQAVDSGGISAPLLSGKSHLGSELDFIYGWNFTDRVASRWNQIGKAQLRARLSAFVTGNAYGDDADDVAYRASLDLVVTF